MQSLTLKGKTAIITGASSGIGAGAAVRFAELGCQLVLAGRNVDSLKDVQQKCVKAGLKIDDVHVSIGEITNEKVRDRIIDDAISHFGKLDILVNNAGIARPGLACDGSAKLTDLHEMMEVNVKAAADLSSKSIEHLKKTKGCIINVSSGAGVRPIPRNIYYCMTKAALDMFTRGLAQEVGAFGIRVNSINPGVIRSSLLASGGYLQAGVTSDAVYHMMANNHALKRIGEPEETANALAFLASDLASFITGAILPVDGGALINAPGAPAPAAQMASSHH